MQLPLQNPHEFCKVSVLYPKDEQPFCYQGSAQHNCMDRRNVLELETKAQGPWRQTGRRQEESAVMCCRSTPPCSVFHHMLQKEEAGDEQVASSLGIPALNEYRAFLDLESSWA